MTAPQNYRSEQVQGKRAQYKPEVVEGLNISAGCAVVTKQRSRLRLEPPVECDDHASFINVMAYNKNTGGGGVIHREKKRARDEHELGVAREDRRKHFVKVVGFPDRGWYGVVHIIDRIVETALVRAAQQLVRCIVSIAMNPPDPHRSK